jgi:superfamily II DNA or RNA helicase
MLAVTPQGSLRLDSAADPLTEAFARGAGHGILHLGATQVGQPLPPVLAFWRDFGARFVTAVCTHPEGRPPVPSDDELAAIARSAPLMLGGEYLSPATFAALWTEVERAFTEERAGRDVQAFVRSLHPAWNVVGRVHFHLAEHKGDEEAPFAFLATYTAKLGAHGKAQHVPLGQALEEYASQNDKLLALLLPVQRAAERCDWLKQLVDEGEIFHPLRFTAAEALLVLRDLGELEQAGVMVRMPAKWGGRRPSRPKVTAKVGGKEAAGLGADALLDFEVEVTLDGERLTPAQIKEILDGQDGLVFLRGRWVEIDRERLGRVLERYQAAEKLAAKSGMTFAQAMRALAEVDLEAEIDPADREWGEVVAGPWLAETLAALRSPEGLARVSPGKALRGTLRPYQEVGVRWLHLLTQLGLGACLADDMGLGKTIQVLGLLVLERGRGPSLLVAPASLLGNWVAEIEKFAPDLRVTVAHPSVTKLAELDAAALADRDLVITTYGSLGKLPATSWQLVILDEAQAIKNPGTAQTKAAKRLEARARIALTGTPVENRVGDLWSIFDFLNPGLLGSAQKFAAYDKRLESYGPLRELVAPYILRRLKTDRKVISDLPDKTEMIAYCHLGKRQALLYQQSVEELGKRLRSSDSKARRGVVLAFLMRFKQICNHPSHWLGDGLWAAKDSGKLARLAELAEVIAAKQEKLLVFSQFREIIPALSAFLAGIFGKTGLTLDGQTPVAKRRSLVQRFQEDPDAPFFVLSLKAGGSGLNLTAASHVVHFDRWWNPAVEDQATDRAFRIGQTRNVLVHKFVCRGTVEDKIDALIAGKRKLATDLLSGGHEIDLTSLDDDDLIRLVSLDMGATLGD